MAYTQDEILELAAVKVQEIVCPKIETFMEGVTKEVHNMHLEMKMGQEFTATVISQLNELRQDVANLKKMKDEVTELHTTLYRNGFVKRFEQLCDDWHDYLQKDRFATCPAMEDIKEIEKKLEEAPRRAQDTKFKTWGVWLAVIAALLNTATLLTKLTGVW